ncbi:MAG: hypothetical protein MZV70_28510 [Desulfobacterales bacterium]|nr:hypothetical protein [Desulfobacterales bacterium]
MRKSLAAAADKRLRDLGYRNVRVRHGDGYEGGLKTLLMRSS